MANWGANHGVLTIGHVGADFITLASMLRIPVCMHNVEETKVYRPSAWAAHGMDIEGQDYALARTTARCTSVNTLLPDVMPGRSGYRA